MKNYIQEQLGKKIQKLRKIKGFNQEAFAETIGIATNTLSSIETGNSFMTASTLEKIIKTLDITPKELFAFPEDNTQEDMYSYIQQKLKFFKNDKIRLKLIYNIIKSLLE